MDKRSNEIVKGVVGILREFLKPLRIIIFGSRAKGNNIGQSDFDFAVDCPRPYISVEREMKEQIEKISGLYGVDIVYLCSVDKDFRQIILKTGRLIYEKRT